MMVLENGRSNCRLFIGRQRSKQKAEQNAHRRPISRQTPSSASAPRPSASIARRRRRCPSSAVAAVARSAAASLPPPRHRRRLLKGIERFALLLVSSVFERQIYTPGIVCSGRQGSLCSRRNSRRNRRASSPLQSYKRRPLILVLLEGRDSVESTVLHAGRI